MLLTREGAAGTSCCVDPCALLVGPSGEVLAPLRERTPPVGCGCRIASLSVFPPIIRPSPLGRFLLGPAPGVCDGRGRPSVLVIYHHIHVLVLDKAGTLQPCFSRLKQSIVVLEFIPYMVLIGCARRPSALASRTCSLLAFVGSHYYLFPVPG